jgi:hypothetical protein
VNEESNLFFVCLEKFLALVRKKKIISQHFSKRKNLKITKKKFIIKTNKAKKEQLAIS